MSIFIFLFFFMQAGLSACLAWTGSLFYLDQASILCGLEAHLSLMIGSGIEHGPPHSVVRPDFVHDPPLFTQVNSAKKMMNNDFFEGDEQCTCYYPWVEEVVLVVMVSETVVCGGRRKRRKALGSLGSATVSLETMSGLLIWRGNYLW